MKFKYLTMAGVMESGDSFQISFMTQNIHGKAMRNNGMSSAGG